MLPTKDVLRVIFLHDKYPHPCVPLFFNDMKAMLFLYLPLSFPSVAFLNVFSNTPGSPIFWEACFSSNEGVPTPVCFSWDDTTIEGSPEILISRVSGKSD